MEALVCISADSVRLPLDTSHHLSNNDQINDQGRRQQRVFTDIEQADSLVTSHEDLGVILVESALVVAHGWHILDYYTVVWMLSLLVENVVGLDHIVYHVGFGNLLRAKLLVAAQIHAIIIAKVVVARNRGELDASVDHEVHERRFHLCLSGFKIITTDEGVMLLGKFNSTRHKSVLGGAVDERGVFKDTSNSENGRWGNFLVTRLDSLHQVVGSIIDTLKNVCVTLRVGSPLNNDFIKAVSLLEISVPISNIQVNERGKESYRISLRICST